MGFLQNNLDVKTNLDVVRKKDLCEPEEQVHECRKNSQRRESLPSETANRPSDSLRNFGESSSFAETNSVVELFDENGGEQNKKTREQKTKK